MTLFLTPAVITTVRTGTREYGNADVEVKLNVKRIEGTMLKTIQNDKPPLAIRWRDDNGRLLCVDAEYYTVMVRSDYGVPVEFIINIVKAGMEISRSPFNFGGILQFLNPMNNRIVWNKNVLLVEPEAMVETNKSLGHALHNKGERYVVYDKERHKVLAACLTREGARLLAATYEPQGHNHADITTLADSYAVYAPAEPMNEKCTKWLHTGLNSADIKNHGICFRGIPEGGIETVAPKGTRRLKFD